MSSLNGITPGHWSADRSRLDFAYSRYTASSRLLCGFVRMNDPQRASDGALPRCLHFVVSEQGGRLALRGRDAYTVEAGRRRVIVEVRLDEAVAHRVVGGGHETACGSAPVLLDVQGGLAPPVVDADVGLRGHREARAEIVAGAVD